MEKTFDENRMLQAAKAFIINTFVNNYAVERVAFGYEKPGDKAPVELYFKQVPIAVDDMPNVRKHVSGVYIDEQERITVEQDYAEFVRDLYIYQMDKIFWDAPEKYLDRNAEEIRLLPRYSECLFGLLPLFAEILKVEVEYSAFDIIPTDKAERATEYNKWKKFVTAILLKPLKSGSKINRYVKDFTNAPHYIRQLVQKKGKNFYLKPVDINSYEYAFALFSLMSFINAENDKIFKLKMFEWERRHGVK